MARRIVEEFIADVRKLCVIYGSQPKLAARLGVHPNTVQRWFNGDKMPLFEHYIAVKQLLAEELEQARKGIGL